MIVVNEDLNAAFLDYVEIVSVGALLHHDVAVLLLGQEKSCDDGVHAGQREVLK